MEGGGWKGGSGKLSIVYFIGWLEGGRTMLGGGTSIMLPLPFCIKRDKVIAVDNINLKIGCPPLNNVIQRGPRSQMQKYTVVCTINIAFLYIF